MGAEDSLIPVEMADKFAEVLQKSKLVVYDGVGHMPMEEIAKRSAQDALLFLEGLIEHQEL